MAKYFIIAGLVANGISILMDIFTTGFNELTYYKLICCGWIVANLVALSRIEDLESNNEILANHIKDIINTVKGYKK